MHIFRLVLLCALSSMLLTVVGCSTEAEQPDIVLTSQGKPALWQVTGAGGNSAYLFGTVHMLPPGTDWQTPTIDEATKQSDSLITEVIGLDDKASVAKTYAEMGSSPDLQPLEKRIPSPLADTLEETLGDAEISANALSKMESWAAALAIANAISGDLGMEASSGAEPLLQARFRAADKPHGGLETVSQQLSYFDKLPEADQRLLLAATLRSAGNARAETQKMLDHWMQGNVDALLENVNNGVLSSPQLRSALLDDRNRRWADQVAKMIDKGRKPFVAVGAAHMAGPGGLPALLKAKGYKVQRIQ